MAALNDNSRKIQLILAHAYCLLVDKPTRGANTLELTFTTYLEQFREVHVEPPIGSNDHDTVICDIVDAAKDPLLTKRSGSGQPIRLEMCFHLANYNAISCCLASCNWLSNFNDCVVINVFWAAFYNIVYELVERFVLIHQKRQ